MTPRADWLPDVPGLAGLAVVIALLAAYSALDVAKRVQAERTTQRGRWLLAASIGFGTGLWAVSIISASALTAGVSPGYRAAIAAAGWAVAVGTSVAGFGWTAGKVVTLPRALCGAAVVASGIVATQALMLMALAIEPGLEFSLPGLAIALTLALAGTAPAFALFHNVLHFRQAGGRWQPLAATGIAVSILASQHLLFGAASLRQASVNAVDSTVLAATLTIGAAVASLALLMMLLVWSLLESQMRESLRLTKIELQRQAFIDPLTKLANRQMFETALARTVKRVDESGGRLALLLIDLDGFKPINETYGHRSGDRVLRELAVRLRALGQAPETVARLGADEFLLLMDADPTGEDASRLAARVLRDLSQPCKVGSREAAVTCSIGIALYPEHGAMSTLIAHADAAMRSAKATGGATYCFFEARMISGAREQVELLRDLRRALAQGELELYYQPKIHAPSGEITGVEALMRWHHPQRGMISPTIFIPIAERFGLINGLGDWMIDEACRQARAWREEGLRMRVAVNLSVYQLRQADLAERISQALKRHHINPKLLTCEITESVAMEDAQTTKRVFEDLALVGVHISIDDFGTGYSSLSYLRKLPAEELKIDRSFVLDLETSADARAVVDAVVKLAQALGLKVVAEGVETEAQGRILASLGCDELQGFLYARPMSARALSLWASDVEEARPIEFRPSLFGETLMHEL